MFWRRSRGVPPPIGSIPPTPPVPRLLHAGYGPSLTYIHFFVFTMAMEMMYYSMAALNGNLSDQLQSQLGYLPMQNGDQKGFQPSYKRMAQSEFGSNSEYWLTDSVSNMNTIFVLKWHCTQHDVFSTLTIDYIAKADKRGSWLSIPHFSFTQLLRRGFILEPKVHRFRRIKARFFPTKFH